MNKLEEIEKSIELIPFNVSNQINDINVKKPKSHSKSSLYFFDFERFEEVKDQDVQAPNTCVQSGLKVIYQ